MTRIDLYGEESALFTLDQIMQPLILESNARQIAPVNASAKAEDLNTYYYKHIAAMNTKYSYEAYDSPRSENAIQQLSQEIPAIHGELSYTVDEYRRVQRGRIGMDARAVQLAKRFGQEESRILLAGDSDTGITSVSTTGTNSTNAETEFNTLSFANIHTTLTSLIGQLITNGIDVGKKALFGVATSDVYKNAMGRLNTDQNKNGVQWINEILQTHGGPGSKLFMDDNLGGVWSGTAGRKTLTAGTTNFCLFTYDPEIYEVVASPLERRNNGFHAIDGFHEQWVERFVPIFKEKLGIIYSGTVGNA